MRLIPFHLWRDLSPSFFPPPPFSDIMKSQKGERGREGERVDGEMEGGEGKELLLVAIGWVGGGTLKREEKGGGGGRGVC